MHFVLRGTAGHSIYTLSLHDALPISAVVWADQYESRRGRCSAQRADRFQSEHVDADAGEWAREVEDRKSTRLNSRHMSITHADRRLKKNQHQGSGRLATGCGRDSCW